MVNIEWEGKEHKEEVELKRNEVYEVIYDGERSILFIGDSECTRVHQDGINTGSREGYRDDFVRTKDSQVLRKITDKVKIVVED